MCQDLGFVLNLGEKIKNKLGNTIVLLKYSRQKLTKNFFTLKLLIWEINENAIDILLLCCLFK